jgi:hypothetical protein
MGGSLATLLAHDLSEKFSHNRVSMYSFGQPRTGNSAFARAYNNANGDSYRIVNEWDVIARFPRAINSSVFNYEHAGRTVLPNYMPPANTTTAADSTSIWVRRLLIHFSSILSRSALWKSLPVCAIFKGKELILFFLLPGSCENRWRASSRDCVPFATCSRWRRRTRRGGAYRPTSHPYSLPPSGTFSTRS